ncbi:nitrate regulatory protein [Oceanospirillum sanctuarii]|uniref:nitrate regulatory protein n=1 Tax=Oceanospirillum sanctuarii TaxID=1434821 RepID=UPI000A35D629|nr:nitrate regulatory protein [Oceanospirillum sanctuarii]
MKQLSVKQPATKRDTLAIDYFLAAHQSEHKQLTQLSESCHLVTVVTELIHELQKERGLSNIYLVSEGKRFADERVNQLQEVAIAEKAFRGLLNSFSCGLHHKASFYSRVAFALNGLDQLAPVRPQISKYQISALEATGHFSQVISRLLQVVFEVADRSTCPETARALVALFNLLQGKEYAGQERAFGAIGFAAGEFDLETLEQLDLLFDAQGNCFDLFLSHSEAAHVGKWREIEALDCSHELLKLRQVYRKAGTSPIPDAMTEVWFDVATNRINAMQELEHLLLADLILLIQQQLDKARDEMAANHDNLEALILQKAEDDTDGSLASGKETLSPDDPKAMGGLFELIQQQASRLQQLNTELNEVRQSLEDRKVIERAKGLLMKKHGVSEDKAYQSLRRVAMNKNTSLIHVARQTVTTLSI